MTMPAHQTVEWNAALTVVHNKIVAEGDVQEGVEQSLSDGHGLGILARAVGQRATSLGLSYESVGGRGVYAYGLAEIMTLVAYKDRPDSDLSWFMVREARKGHGLGRITEGARIEGQDVLLLDTVAQPDALLATCRDTTDIGGAQIVGILPLVDLGEGVREQLAEQYPSAAYSPLFVRADFEGV